MSFSQSDCSISGQYDVILPFLSKNITPMPFSSWNVNKLRTRCCLLDTSLLRHIMTLFNEKGGGCDIIEIDNDERGVIGDFTMISNIRITKAKR